jgi:hypothetical protein
VTGQPGGKAVRRAMVDRIADFCILPDDLT